MDTLFSGINKGNKAKLLKYLEAVIFTYKKNVNLTDTFRHDNLIGIVLSGYLEICKSDYEGNIRFIDSLDKDDVFGTTLDGINYGDYDIVTKEESKIIVIDYNNIINFSEFKFQYYTIFVRNLLKICEEKMDKKNLRVEILTQKSIRNKLLEYFRIMSQKNNSKIIYIPRTFSELADYLGVDRCAMSREIKKLKDDGFIEVKNKRINLKY